MLAFSPSVPLALAHALPSRTASQRPSSSRSARMSLDGHEELEVLFDGGDGYKSAKYRLDLTIAGADSRANRKMSIQQIKQRGNFDGFRKGTIPPFVMKQVNGASGANAA